MADSSRQRKSRRYIWQGGMLLTLGSALLLCCKFSVSPWMHSALLFSGGGAILLGNGYMLYGLLYHADDRVYQGEHASDESASPADTAPCSTATQSQPPPSLSQSQARHRPQDSAQSTAHKA